MIASSVLLIFVPAQGDTITTTVLSLRQQLMAMFIGIYMPNTIAAMMMLTGSVDYGGTYQIGGQRYYEENYWWYAIFRSIDHFDTSPLPDDAAIINVILSLYILEDHSDTNFNVVVQSSTTFPHNPIEAGDYYSGYYTTEGG